MKSVVCVAVIAQPGHFRDSLVALLRTFPHLKIILAAGVEQGAPNALGPISPDIWIVDSESCAQDFTEMAAILGDRWTGTKRIVLVDNVLRIRAQAAFGVDCVLTKNTSAGEFLSEVSRMVDEYSAEVQRRERQGKIVSAPAL